MKIYLLLLLLLIPIVSGLNCEIGTPQEVYGEDICLVNQTTEYGLSHTSLSIYNFYIPNLGLSIFPSQPLMGWIIIFFALGIFLKYGYQYEKTFRAKVMNKIGFN